jgi:hypothetical protein
VQIKQGVHGSKFQQEDWRAGRKGGADANVVVGSLPDAREDAFTDVRVQDTPASPAAPRSAANGAARGGAPAKENTNGTQAHGNSLPDAPVNGSVWSKDQELALIKALKSIAKDADDRCGARLLLHAVPWTLLAWHVCMHACCRAASVCRC